MFSRNEILRRTECLTPDGDVIAINKPPRIAVCGPSMTSTESLQGLVQRHIGPEFHATHRLDRDTTGHVLFGATSSARRRISEAFKNRRVVKEYVAVVHGEPCSKIAGCLCSLTPDGSFVRVNRTNGGKIAASAVEVVRPLGNDYTLVRIRPLTGRQHQIRVHLGNVIGHPIAGDELYYPEDDRAITIREKDEEFKPPRTLLHAAGIQVPYAGEILTCQAALAADFQLFIDQLETSA